MATTWQALQRLIQGILQMRAPEGPRVIDDGPTHFVDLINPADDPHWRQCLNGEHILCRGESVAYLTAIGRLDIQHTEWDTSPTPTRDGHFEVTVDVDGDNSERLYVRAAHASSHQHKGDLFPSYAHLKLTA